MNRRTFLHTAAAATGALALPRRAARAATVSAADLKFLFVFNRGGWDPTRVFANSFRNGNVDMESDAEETTTGGITFVDHPDRPNVSAFFSAHHDRTLVLNGVQVRSIAHEICTMIAMTGTSSGLQPDWPAILATAQSDRYTLPHLVLGGPSFAGDLGVSVARAGYSGQLDGLLSGDILDWSDSPVSGLSAPATSLVDRYVQRRADARAATAVAAQNAALSAEIAEAVAGARALKDMRYVMDFSAGSQVGDQGVVAVDALSLGLSRCVTLGFPGDFAGLGWDTHADNDATQSTLFDALFAGLAQLMALLSATPGDAAERLADETVLVVLSEMGRTPQKNGLDGKDHWPYTSVMIVGPGVEGDRVVGGFDDSFYGYPVDPGSGEVDEGGQVLSAEAVGATLLTLADVDPGPYVSGVEALTGVLS